MALDSLSERMASAARELQQQHDPGATLRSAAHLTLTNLSGCDSVGISIVHRDGRVETDACTDDRAARADQLQYEIGEGPCLDAVWQEQTTHTPDLMLDARWPRWGPQVAAETGLRSVLAFQLFTTEDTLGALNVYSSQVDAFTLEDREDGLALAAHVAIAVSSAARIQQLNQAMDTRTVIAQATGIVMERFDLDGARAFQVLSRLSSRSERKLRDVAAEVVETRRFPDPDQAEPSGVGGGRRA
ncbi:GAF and ANTAR domain-containing protein [Nocardioides sp. 503]|uniref:GAF and ANTAR domain-containing protein n=1 Tax=Nocardioides sp. 503 TaxID=2508326 RepID=UPI001430CE92|nr:GAF and ANTAR domain-containing protein [Nocardioides sp. 503]